VAYGAAEAGREYNAADVSERTLREIYFPPFRGRSTRGPAR
jgi:beta-glucosidase